ncbi:glycosyltransferase family 87 protein [Amycolatopsis alkalitolerans]|uniref:glycosyltransferase family 87 protein n=1 Tax=Amycolatopsis alkalitolerans TaxID=2547244 RepID=UPI001F270CCE|nr:glycosyltransferase family 87 protein [Amycolatopsis alkalitolerans]
MSSLVKRAGVKVLAPAALLLVLAFIAHGFPKHPSDVDVYRLGAQTFLRGRSIYTQLPVSTFGGALPYTYPPSSAVLFVPLALIPPAIGFPLLTAATSLALIPLVLAYRDSSPDLRGLLAKPWVVLAAAIALLVGHPVANTIYWGQINVLLMLLVALDCLSPNPRWPRGLLIGIAAAVKLTPAGFVLFFLLRKDYRAVATSALGFLALTAITFALAPSDSVFYWTNRVFHATSMNIGGPLANESVFASLHKLGLHGTALTLTGALTVIAVVVMAWLGTRRALTDGELPLALGVNAAAVQLISPISWSHQWVLALPTAAVVLASGYRRHDLRLLITGGIGVAIIWLAPHYWMPQNPAVWTIPEKIAGSTYQLAALALLAVTSYRQLAKRPPRRPRTGSTGELDFELAA